MTPVGLEPTNSAGERPQTHALDRAATGTGVYWVFRNKLQIISQSHKDEYNQSDSKHIVQYPYTVSHLLGY